MAEAQRAQDKPHTLDEMMIAMDVVDTIRHSEDLVRAELNEVGREAELIERLREIYRQQGIDVPDHVLEEGVKALKDSRFTYTPPPRSWKRTLFEWWTMRTRIGAFGGVALAGLLTTCGVHYFTVTRPANLAESRARIELSETLPKELRQLHADVLKIATEDRANQQADRIFADAERAISDKNREGMISARTALADLRDEVAAEYTLRIVSRPGQPSGVWRRPPKGATARNYYLIVEARKADGSVLKLPIRNEENGTTSVVDKFGVRVPEATYDAVAADKRDNGIVENSLFGTKERGKLTIRYNMPFNGGMITKW